MNKYILITFYPNPSNTGQVKWIVYGHIAPGINERIGEYSKAEAIEKCFSYGVPVMLGRNYESVLSKLENNAPAGDGGVSDGDET
jgi:hypothetical protein